MSRVLAIALFALSMGACLLGARSTRAETAPVIDPSIGHVDVVLDLPKDEPYVGEMILLRMRTTIRGDVALDEIRQPPLANFNWQQLGRDKPIRVMAEGFNVPGYERDIAIFPQQAGRLIIEPFVRHVTMIVGVNQRVEADFTSKPVYVDVQRHEGISPPGTWWLPAKSVTVRETWSPRPDAVEPGQVARRVVVIEAAGVTADRLPPAPSLRAPGLITFTGPATRETILTANGPIARAVYQWDVRPVTNTPAKLPALHVPWFDTATRRMRDTAIAEQWVGYVGMATSDQHHVDVSFAARYLQPGPLVAGLAGLAWAFALTGLVVASPPRHGAWFGSARPAALGRLAKAARRGDANAVKAALTELARADSRRWRLVATAPSVAPALAQLDASLYARDGVLPPVLPRLAAEIIRLWRASMPFVPPREAEALPPLDGDPALDRSWYARLIAPAIRRPPGA